MTLQKRIRKILKEEISAKDAYNEYDSIKTIVDGKRDVAFTSLDKPTSKLYVLMNGLKKIKVVSNDEVNYIVYRKGAENMAEELLKIANKYGGKLHYDATEEDSRRIGQILNYHPKEIEDYIEYNKTAKNNLQESVRRVIKENELPLSFRRRFHEMDELLFELMKTTYAPHKVCSYNNSEQFIDHLTFDIINEHMYYKYFEHIDDLSEEWESLYRVMEEYLMNKYRTKLDEYYHINCGD